MNEEGKPRGNNARVDIAVLLNDKIGWFRRPI